METSTILLFIVTASISFGIGRTFVYFRDRKKKKHEETRKALLASRQGDEPESMNKAKRKRQLRQAGPQAKGGKR
jgi:hypothetical protein